MELTVKLNVTPDEVFNELANTILEDVKKSTGRPITCNEIKKDFSYKKHLKNHVGNDVTVEVIVNEFVSPKNYSATITNPKGVNTVEYVLTEEMDGVSVFYKENFKSSSFLQNANYILMSFLYTRGSKKKMMRQFMLLEQQILEKRK